MEAAAASRGADVPARPGRPGGRRSSARRLRTNCAITEL